jgi:hypothetical protein
LAGEGRAGADMLPAHGALLEANGDNDLAVAACRLACGRNDTAGKNRREGKQTTDQAHRDVLHDRPGAASFACLPR